MVASLSPFLCRHRTMSGPFTPKGISAHSDFMYTPPQTQTEHCYEKYYNQNKITLITIEKEIYNVIKVNDLNSDNFRVFSLRNGNNLFTLTHDFEKEEETYTLKKFNLQTGRLDCQRKCSVFKSSLVIQP